MELDLIHFSPTLPVSNVIVTRVIIRYFKEPCSVSSFRRTEQSGLSATDPMLENASD